MGGGDNGRGSRQVVRGNIQQISPPDMEHFRVMLFHLYMANVTIIYTFCCNAFVSSWLTISVARSTTFSLIGKNKNLPHKQALFVALLFLHYKNCSCM